MRIAITGSRGFIGKNLCLRFRELGHDVREIRRDLSPAELAEALAGADFVLHFAGVNRPRDEQEFTAGNVDYTQALCAAMEAAQLRAPVVYASSAQAVADTPYGRSKRDAENVLFEFGSRAGVTVSVLRLPNVFGKWGKPHYNSVVATFCHQIARQLPIAVHDPAAPIRLVHVDDLASSIARLLDSPPATSGYADVAPVYETTVGELAAMLQSFADSRSTLTLSGVGAGLPRALYATYVSYLPPESFAYDVPKYADSRGAFLEMLRTADSGQFGYFTAHPGITRGEHYHHSKTEKFLVAQGVARFGFRNVATGEVCEITARGGDGRIVESIPGWTHNVTNVGEGELIVLVWANELFDRARPDTVAMKV